MSGERRSSKFGGKGEARGRIPSDVEMPRVLEREEIANGRQEEGDSFEMKATEKGRGR